MRLLELLRDFEDDPTHAAKAADTLETACETCSTEERAALIKFIEHKRRNADGATKEKSWESGTPT